VKLKSSLLLSLSIVALLLSLPSMLLADGACTTTTLASLETSGGCTIGDKTFFNFFLTEFNGVPVQASDVTVTPISSEPFGFTFSLQTPPSGGTTFLSIDFQVETTVGANTIEDLELRTSGISGASTGAVENVCIGPNNIINGFLPNNIPTCTLTPSGLRIVTGYGEGSSASVTFAPSSAVDLSTGFIFNNGNPISITEQILQVSEPSSLMLICIGLLAFGFIALKKSSS
jgi:hypothetical protein